MGWRTVANMLSMFGQRSGLKMSFTYKIQFSLHKVYEFYLSF